MDTTNVILGLDAGEATGTNQGNVLLGYKVAGGGLGSGAYNVIALGREAAYNVGNKDNIIAIGYKAARNTQNYNGVWIGYEAGMQWGGAGNTMVGYQAGRGDSGASNVATYNTFIGDKAGYIIADGDNNTALGQQSLYSLSDGSSNIAIGDRAGANIVDGSRNIVIGLSASLAGDHSDQLFIGSASFATISASLVTGDIIFPSTASAAYFSGDGSKLTNLPASDPFPFTGDAQITGSLIVSGSSIITGSFGVTSDAGQMFQLNNDGTFTLGDGAVVASSNATAVGTGANANGNASAFGNSANASGGGGCTFGSYSSAAGSYSVAIGYDADSTLSNAISIGAAIANSGANSIILDSSGTNSTVTTAEKVFRIYMTDHLTPDIQFGNFATKSILRTNIEINSPSASAATSSLSVHGSGSTVFDVIGSEGTLFSVDDDLNGMLFTTNDISGLPILQASASGELYLGKSPQSLYTTAIISATSASSTASVYALSTSSYDGAFFDYTISSASNAHAGSIMSIWNGETINYTDTATTDIGSTAGIDLQVVISASQAQLIAITDSTDPNTWKVKTIVRSI